MVHRAAVEPKTRLEVCLLSKGSLMYFLSVWPVIKLDKEADDRSARRHDRYGRILFYSPDGYVP
jgi:hypothetical protein